MTIKVSRTAIAEDGVTHVAIELILDGTGVTVIKSHGDVVEEMARYSIDEHETIYELMTMLRPAYLPKA